MELGRIRVSRTTKLSLLLAGVGLVVLLGVWYTTAFRSPNEISLQELAKPEGAVKSPDPVYLSTLSAPEAIRDHLLDGSFRIVYQMQDISGSCGASFYSSFARFSKIVPKNEGEVDFANPGQDFNYGDALVGGLPFRRLHFAGLGPKSCFVFYQQGGRNYPSSCLAVVQYSSGKTVWVGSTRENARDLRQLRFLLIKNQFDDKSGPVC